MTPIKEDGTSLGDLAYSLDHLVQLTSDTKDLVEELTAQMAQQTRVLEEMRDLLGGLYREATQPR